MDTIAAAAGISKGSVYRYFPDKSSLFLASIRTAINDSISRYHPSGSGYPEAQVRRLWLLANDGRFRPAYQLALTQPKGSDAVQETDKLVKEGLVNPLTDFLLKTEREAIPSRDDAFLTAHLVVATILGASLLPATTPESMSARIAFLLRACGLDSQSPQADGF